MTIKEIFKDTQRKLIENTIDLNINAKEIETMTECINRELSKAAFAAFDRETQLLNIIKKLGEKLITEKLKYKNRSLSQAEIDSWNGMSK